VGNSARRPIKDPHRQAGARLHARLRQKIIDTGIEKLAGGIVGIPLLLAVLVYVTVGVPGWVPLIGKDEPAKVTAAPVINVLTDQDRIGIDGVAVGGTYVFPDLFPKQLMPPPSDAVNSCSGRYTWALTQGGVVSTSQRLRVTIELGTLRTLSLTSVKPVLVANSTTDPLPGTEARCAGTGGPGIPQLTVGLSREGATATYVDGDESPTEFYFDVTADQPATFDVDATPTNCDCAWELEVTTIENGVAKSHRVVDADGRPFRVTSSEAATPVAWDLSSGQWLPIQTAPTQPPPSIDPPPTSSSICVAAQRKLAETLPPNAVYDNVLVPFSLTGDDPAIDENAGFSSLCSWTYGPPGDDGEIPTAAVQDWRFPALAGADAFWDKALKKMSPNGWTDIAGGALLSNDGGAAALRDGTRVLLVTTAPSESATTTAMVDVLVAQVKTAKQ